MSGNEIPPCSYEYTREFEDDFDADSLDLTKWKLQDFGQGETNGSDKEGYYSLDNISLLKESGISFCRVTAKKETVIRRAVSWKPDNEILEDGLPNRRTFYYTSSNIWSQDEYLYGKYEMRCRMPGGKGFWPAFWMFGGSPWNEIDVFDNYGGITKLETSIGYGEKPHHNGCPQEYSNFDFSTWHTFTCFFTPAKIGWFIDHTLVRVSNRYYFNTDPEPISCESAGANGNYYELQAYPRGKMHIVFGLQIGSGNGPCEAPDGQTQFPAAFDIDYIKFFRQEARSSFCDDVSISLFPNPTSGLFEIKFDNNDSSCKAIFVSDMIGKSVWQKINTTESSFTIDLSHYPSGVYIIKIMFKDCVVVKNLVYF